MDTFNEATKLANLRLQARAEKNWQEADRLRDEIAHLGYKVLDTPDGFTLQEETYRTLDHINDVKSDSISFTNHDTVVCLVVEGWPQDTIDAITGIFNHTPFSVAVLDVSKDDATHSALLDFQKQYSERLEIVIVNQTLEQIGWAVSYNQLIRAVNAQHVVVMDSSTQLTGDAITPLIEHLTDDVVAAGWKGANVAADWLSFDSATGLVDALLSYLFVVKRAVMREHPFDAKAKFYRNADLEWSLQIRAAGFSLYASTEELPCIQGRHHGYHDSAEEYRTRESKRNYDRLLSKFRGKSEILVPKGT